MLATSVLYVSCSSDDNTEEKFKKLDQILSGSSLTNATLSTDFTWVGEQMRQVDEYEEGQIVDQTKVIYTSETGTQIAELQMYKNYWKNSLYQKALRAINQYLQKENKELIQYMRIVPTYQSNKITRLDIYGYLDGKDLPYIGYLTITYTNDNPSQVSTKILYTMAGNPIEIEVMKMYYIWNNGNIVTEYTKAINFETPTAPMITTDSTVYTYDNKINAFSSLRSSPLIDAQVKSRNNILTSKFYFLDQQTNTMRLSIESSSTYTYDSQNYPTSSEDSEIINFETTPYTYTKVRLFEYKTN